MLNIISMRIFSLLILFLNSIIINAQSPNFVIQPNQGFCINSTNNSATVTVINSSTNISYYTWSAGHVICSGTTVTTATNGSTAVLIFPSDNFCCGVFFISCSAFDSSNILLGSTGLNYTIYCNPNISILTSAANNSPCAATTTTLTATGAQTYSWSGPGVQSFTNTNISVSPTTTSCYSVTGTNTFGCHSTSSLCLSVQPLPTITISGNNTVCAGSSASFSCSGANTYTWSTGSTSAVVSVTPTSNAIYSVIGTDTNGCINSQHVQVKVSSCVGLEDDFQLDDVIRIYPNPVNEFLNLENNAIEDNSSIGVRVINNLGQIIFIQEITFRNKNAQLNISGLDAGMYSLQIMTKNNIPIIKRFVKK
jgi:hypothetical protein